MSVVQHVMTSVGGWEVMLVSQDSVRVHSHASIPLLYCCNH